METHLLIDGKNTIYRSVFSNPVDIHPFTLWLKFADIWIKNFNPVSVHIFWDCDKSVIWRKKLLNEYKDHRDSMAIYRDDNKQLMSDTINAAMNVLKYMGVRQYNKDTQESDDLIYSMCRLLTPKSSDERRIYIVSSDRDFVQIQWHMKHVQCYEPQSRRILELPESDPTIIKALMGDKSDNVDGYRGIGEVKSARLAKDRKALFEFLDNAGTSIFKRNMILVDMSLNPNRLNNELYLSRELCNDVIYDKNMAINTAIKHKIRGFNEVYANASDSFRKLK